MRRCLLVVSVAAIGGLWAASPAAAQDGMEEEELGGAARSEPTDVGDDGADEDLEAETTAPEAASADAVADEPAIEASTEDDEVSPDDGSEPAADAGDDAGVELDEWGLPIEEEEEPPPPPPPYDTRLGYEVLGTFVGALSLSAVGFGIGAATVGITTRERTADEILLGAALGTGLALPFGAALGVYLAGGANGGTGTPAGAILGSLLGAGVGVGLGLGLGLGLDDFAVGAIAGGVTGATLSLIGAVVGYELTSGPHPETESTDGVTWMPVLAPTQGGAVVGAAGRF